MYKFATIDLKKRGTPTKLGFTWDERLKFFFGFPMKYLGQTISGYLGERRIFVDLLRGGAIPEIPPEVTERATYETAGFTSRYPNGRGYYGETLLSSRTLDNEQSLFIQGLTTTAIREALEHFERGELPSNWEERPPQKTPRVVQVRPLSCREEEELYDLETNAWGGPNGW